MNGREPHQLIRYIVLDLVAETPLLASCPAIFAEDVSELLGMPLALSAKFGKAAVYALGVGFHSKQLVLRVVVDKGRWRDLNLLLSVFRSV